MRHNIMWPDICLLDFVDKPPVVQNISSRLDTTFVILDCIRAVPIKLRRRIQDVRCPVVQCALLCIEGRADLV